MEGSEKCKSSVIIQIDLVIDSLLFESSKDNMIIYVKFSFTLLINRCRETLNIFPDVVEEND
jgi:hypothetical protein